jgi:hypothetical protein
MSTAASIWSKLDSDGLGDSGYVRLRVAEIDACATYIARNLTDGREALVVEVPTSALPRRPSYPESVGFSVTPEVLKPGREGTTRLILSLSDVRFRDVFRSLGEDVLRALTSIESPSDAIAELVDRLARWQAFLRKHGTAGLGRESRRGLFGELWLLDEKLLGWLGSSEALRAWVGWSGANQDFHFESAFLEVKTTGANTPHAFHVSNFRQLDPAQSVDLYLWLVVIQESETVGQSLPDLIDELRSAVPEQHGQAITDRLVDVGYLEEHRQIYRTPLYSVVQSQPFLVNEGFPRLTADSLPTGVEEVRYQIAVAACSPFARDECEVRHAIGGGRE